MKQTTTTDKSILDTLGLTFVSALDKEQDKVFLGLAPYARYFHLNLAIKNAKDYLHLLEESKKTGLLIKVYLFPQTNEVALIEKASEKEMKEYNKHRIIKVEPD